MFAVEDMKSVVTVRSVVASNAPISLVIMIAKSIKRALLVCKLEGLVISLRKFGLQKKKR